MRKVYSMIIMLAISIMVGCSLLEMDSDQLKAFGDDCLQKGLLVQITIDPVSNEQVAVECINRFNISQEALGNIQKK